MADISARLPVDVVAGATITSVGLHTLAASPNYIGLTTVDIGTQNKVAVTGNVTLSNSQGFIGLVTVGNTPNVAVVGNVTLSDPKTFIGLTTTVLGNNSIQAFGQFFPTPQSIASGGLGPILLDQFGRPQIAAIGNITLSDSKGFIGLVTLGGGTAWTDPKTFIGLVTTIGTSTFGGNVTLNPGPNFIGLVTVGNTPNVNIVGNITLSNPQSFIGLVTAVVGNAETQAIPVYVTDVTPEAGIVIDYNTAAAVAASGTNSHTRQVTSGKTYIMRSITVSASGELKFVLRAGPTSAATTYITGFTSKAEPTFHMEFPKPILVSAGSIGTVMIDRTNRESSAMDVYSTMFGDEV